MSIFAAPTPRELAAEERAIFRGTWPLGLLRQGGVFLSLIGAFGALLHFVFLGLVPQTLMHVNLKAVFGPLMQPAFLTVWVSLCLSGALIMVVCSSLAARIAAARGGRLLGTLREDQGSRSLSYLVEQMQNTHVIIDPVLRLGGEEYRFSLIAVAEQGVTFIRTAAHPAKPLNLGPLKDACLRVSEQYGLSLLARPRFVQISTGTAAEKKLGPDWQTCPARDLSRLFLRSGTGPGAHELARTCRAVFNLTLSPHATPVPVEGTLPSSVRPQRAAARVRGGEVARQRQSTVTALKIMLFLASLAGLAGGGLYALTLYRYETAEKIMAPARAVLRNVLPQEWRDKLALGTEVNVNESNVTATVVGRHPARLSKVVGFGADGALVPVGTELCLLQERVYKAERWYLVSTAAQEAGWLPASVLRPRHLLPAGTPLYGRPSQKSIPLERAPQDAPVALLTVWRRPSSTGTVTWSKIAFLDRKKVCYVLGEI
ncbi:MAG: hypothetical protein ACM3XS_09905 [Bacteroidota bacterium]